MAEQSKPRPILIPPLVKTSAHLEVLHEHPQPHRAVEHPHCNEHFLFTPHCAACLEAERTQTASAYATPITPPPASPKPKPIPKSSRSFGFTDNITEATFIDPYRTYTTVNDDIRLIDDILDI